MGREGLRKRGPGLVASGRSVKGTKVNGKTLSPSNDAVRQRDESYAKRRKLDAKTASNDKNLPAADDGVGERADESQGGDVTNNKLPSETNGIDKHSDCLECEKLRAEKRSLEEENRSLQEENKSLQEKNRYLNCILQKIQVAVKEYDSEEPTNGEERISSGSHVNSQRFSSDEEEEEEDLETVLKFKGDEKNVVKLVDHSDEAIFILNKSRNNLLESSENQKVIARNILQKIVKPESLSQSYIMGRKGKKLPSKILNEVIAFIRYAEKKRGWQPMDFDVIKSVLIETTSKVRQKSKK